MNSLWSLYVIWLHDSAMDLGKWIQLLPLAVIALLTVLFYLVVPPVERGIFCADDTINLPYNPAMTISLDMLLLMSFVFSSFYIALSEVYLAKTFSSLNTFPSELLPFTFGYLMTLFFTIFTKNRVGRLRPYYLDFCDPDLSGCFDPKTNQTVKELYLDHVKCRKVESYTSFQVLESRMSFFSGHSSLMAYSMSYLIIHLHNKWPMVHVIFRSFLQFIMLLLSIYVGMSRVSDGHHFASDVFVGLVVGASIGAITQIVIAPECTDIRKLMVWMNLKDRTCSLVNTSDDSSDESRALLSQQESSGTSRFADSQLRSVSLCLKRPSAMRHCNIDRSSSL